MVIIGYAINVCMYVVCSYISHLKPQIEGIYISYVFIYHIYTKIIDKDMYIKFKYTKNSVNQIGSITKDIKNVKKVYTNKLNFQSSYNNNVKW